MVYTRIERVWSRSNKIDIWLDRCNRTIECSYCGEDIVNGDIEVFGRYWQRRTKEGGSTVRWVKTFHWHAQKMIENQQVQCCWLKQALESLALHPHIETRGRRSMVLPVEQKAARLKILQKRARIIQVIVEETGKPVHLQSIDRIIRLGSQLESLKEQIAPLGGVPKTWL